MGESCLPRSRQLEPVRCHKERRSQGKDSNGCESDECDHDAIPARSGRMRRCVAVIPTTDPTNRPVPKGRPASTNVAAPPMTAASRPDRSATAGRSIEVPKMAPASSSRHPSGNRGPMAIPVVIVATQTVAQYEGGEECRSAPGREPPAWRPSDRRAANWEDRGSRRYLCRYSWWHQRLSRDRCQCYLVWPQCIEGGHLVVHGLAHL